MDFVIANTCHCVCLTLVRRDILQLYTVFTQFYSMNVYNIVSSTITNAKVGASPTPSFEYSEESRAGLSERGAVASFRCHGKAENEPIMRVWGGCTAVVHEQSPQCGVRGQSPL